MSGNLADQIRDIADNLAEHYDGLRKAIDRNGENPENYAAGYAGRHNDREQDTIDIMAHMVRGMVRKRLRYRDLVA